MIGKSRRLIYQRWLDKRIPRHTTQRLNQKKIFIFPSRQGVYFVGVLLLLLLAAINYQNNLIYLLVFCLASLFNSAIFFTYFNVAGLQLNAGKTHACFAGDDAAFELQVKRDTKRTYQQITVAWPEAKAQTFDLFDDTMQTLTLYVKTQQRGYFRPGRLRLQSHYPLGLLRCWSWLDLDFQTVVYPQPMAYLPLSQALAQAEQGQTNTLLNADELYDFRPYQTGDSLRHVHWPSVAKAQTMQSKVYAAHSAPSHDLQWQMVAGLTIEQRLSCLAAWILQLEALGAQWSLSIPGVNLAKGAGELHKAQGLRALALYGLHDE